MGLAALLRVIIALVLAVVIAGPEHQALSA